MKSFYHVNEPNCVNYMQYLKEKRQTVLDTIKPICKAFGIEEYNYTYSEDGHNEELVVEGQAIGCSCNSIGAIVDELIGYIFIKCYCKNSYLGAFDRQTKNYIKRYWLKEN